jgi:hypothetical protein
VTVHPVGEIAVVRGIILHGAVAGTQKKHDRKHEDKSGKTHGVAPCKSWIFETEQGQFRSKELNLQEHLCGKARKLKTIENTQPAAGFLAAERPLAPFIINENIVK